MVDSILVIGGGVSGITAALDLADQGNHVFLVEKEPSIGGKMAKLDKTFPTLDCSLCILAPKMVDISRRPNITLLTYSEVKDVQRISDQDSFKVRVHRKPRYVKDDRCTGCRLCVQKCPIRVPNEFEEGLNQRKAIYIPFPQAVPAVATIDSKNCLYFTKGVCQVCKKFCPANAVDFDQKPSDVELEVKAIVVATGFMLLDPSSLPQYGYKRFPNVLTSMEYERLLNAAGPTGGEVLRPSDMKPPRKVAFIQCVGSRNWNVRPYCSQICCMYATKEAVVTREHDPTIEIAIFFDNLRAVGKEHHEFVNRAAEEFKIRYIKGLPSEVQPDLKTGSLKLRYADLVAGEVRIEVADLVVLCPAVIPNADTEALAKILGIEVNEYGFFGAKDPLAPVDTVVPGIYLCGACEGSKDISHSVAQASAAALRATSRTKPMKVTAERMVEELSLLGEPRIGVFVCRCGVNIASVVDVPKVVEYAKGLPGVVYAQEGLFTCSKDSTERIKEVITKEGLNRVVVAACTPRTHEPLFRETCEEAGLNPYLFEMVNIREHDSWVHPGEPERATTKAMGLVKMAVEKARRLEPLKRLEADVVPAALVIGGGVAGLVAAKAIGDKGFKVFLVEREKELGGRRAKGYTLPFSDIDFPTLLSPLVSTVRKHEKIEVLDSTVIKDVKGALGNFSVTVSQGGKNRSLAVGVMINATGSEELKPKGLYGYGDSPKVQTLTEFRESLKTEDVSGPVVVILCAGAREKQGRTYCSSTCCAEGLDLVLKLKEKSPDSPIFVLFQDIRLPMDAEKFYRDVRESGVIFVRYDPEKPPKVTTGDSGLRVDVEDMIMKVGLQISASRVVLATPLIPRATNSELSSQLKVPLTTSGFFLEVHPKLRPLDFATDGIYLCGTCHSPQTVTECVYQALGAASRALVPLMKGRVKSEAITALVDQNLCIGCANCEAVCEYNAIKVVGGRAEVNPILCKGCGTCAVECPAMAITMQGFTSDQISSMIHAALEPMSKDEIRIVAFFCNWCAYAGADMAGVSRYQYPPNVRIIRVMCSGRVDENHILQAFLKGADGVLIGGCHVGDCHYLRGNVDAEKRVRSMRPLLKAAGFEPERLRLEWVSAGEGQRLAGIMKEFTEQIEKLGPNPLRMVRGGDQAG